MPRALSLVKSISRTISENAFAGVDHLFDTVVDASDIAQGLTSPGTTFVELVCMKCKHVGTTKNELVCLGRVAHLRHATA